MNALYWLVSGILYVLGLMHFVTAFLDHYFEQKPRPSLSGNETNSQRLPPTRKNQYASNSVAQRSAFLRTSPMSRRTFSNKQIARAKSDSINMLKAASCASSPGADGGKNRRSEQQVKKMQQQHHQSVEEDESSPLERSHSWQPGEQGGRNVAGEDGRSF